MAASRKLYREIADSLRLALIGSSTERAEGIASAARNIANDLKTDNPNFRYDMFFEAAGLDSFGQVKEPVSTSESHGMLVLSTNGASDMAALEAYDDEYSH